MKFGDWDAFLLAGRYTLLEQGPLDDLLPMCSCTRHFDCGAGGPLTLGILAGRDTWNYAAAPTEIVKAGAIRFARYADAHSCRCPRRRCNSRWRTPAVAAIIPGPDALLTSSRRIRGLIPPTDFPAALWADLRDQQLLHPEVLDAILDKGDQTMPEVYVHAIEGRSKDQKRALIKDITDAW